MPAPVRYLGRTNYQHGKRLFDILCRLKHFGKGRIVYRNVFKERYEEPSYYIITNVNPDMKDPTLKEPSDHLRGYAVGMKVFRGEEHGEKAIHAAYKPDWRLVPKAEEKDFLNFVKTERPRPTVPNTVPLPPLLQYMVKQNSKSQTINTQDNNLPLLRLNINKKTANRAMYESEARLLKDQGSV